MTTYKHYAKEILKERRMKAVEPYVKLFQFFLQVVGALACLALLIGLFILIG